MKGPHVNRRIIVWSYRIARVLVRLALVLVLLGMGLFIYLRFQGVPAPLLEKAIRRANEAGVPVEAEGIILTLKGWRADKVRYYSNRPDDLDPIFQADKVFFEFKGKFGRNLVPKDGMNIAVRALGIHMVPSGALGVSISEESSARNVDQIDVMLEFRPDRLSISNGTMEWLGCHFNVNGDILKRDPDTPRLPSDDELFGTLLPIKISKAQFQQFENHLTMLSLPEGVTVKINFKVDTTDYDESWVDFQIDAKQPSISGVAFSRLEIVGNYTYPLIRFERVGMFHGKKSFQVGGEYSLSTKLVEGTLYNSLTSTQVLQLLPESIHTWMADANFRMDYLPRLELSIGPALPKELANHLSGAFSLRNVAYQGMELETIRGKLDRSNNRLTLTDLQGVVLDQTELAVPGGTCMQGGPFSGEVFWDEALREFGVEADIGFDPHLLKGPLSPVKIATTIINYFSFTTAQPNGHLTLGANIDDWRSFYLNIQAVGQNTSFRGAEFSSINTTAEYRKGVLQLDPIAVRQGIDFAKGAVTIDFRKNVLTVDAQGSLNPSVIEDVAYPDLNLFGHLVHTKGQVRIAVQGDIDWATMQATDFSATVAADQLSTPVGFVDAFKATVQGKGPLLSVHDATGLFFGGDVFGNFSLRVEPKLALLPYEADFAYAEADFKRFLDFYSNSSAEVSGKFSGKVHIDADLSTNFFAVAKGSGTVRLRDGQLTDLPLFKGFSRAMRVVIPGFKVFAITKLSGDFSIKQGAIESDNAVFEGPLINASGRGSYRPDIGFDAIFQAHMLRNKGISKIIRTITDPLLKIFEVRLTGPLSDPSWRLNNLP